MENPSSTQNTAGTDDSGFDLMDNSIAALEKELTESKQDAHGLIKAWLQPLRDAGYPTIAYELERLEEAMRMGNVMQIRESLVKSARLSEDALGKADGMIRTKLLTMINLLKAAASQFETDQE